MGSSIYVFCGESRLVMIKSSSKFFALSQIKITWYGGNMTPVLVLLVIWGLGGMKQKLIIKGAGFIMDKALFRVGGKNLDMFRLKI